MNDIDKLTLELIQFSVDLANSVQKDLLENSRQISDHTVICVSRVKRKHDELDGALDAEQGVN